MAQPELDYIIILPDLGTSISAVITYETPSGVIEECTTEPIEIPQV
jgi:hypothetical protein